MKDKRAVKCIFNIKKTWFEPVESFEFVIEDYLGENLEVNTRITYGDYQPTLNKAQEAKRDIKEYIKSNNLEAVTRRELEGDIICSQSTIKIAIKELLKEGFFIEQGHTKNKRFIVSTQLFKPNELKKQGGQGNDLVMDI